MAKRSKLTDGETASVVGRVFQLNAPNKAPGGPDGPTYIEFPVAGETEGRLFFGVFYIKIDPTDGLAAVNAANAARAYASGEPVKVTFPAEKWPDHAKDPSAVVMSVVPDDGAETPIKARARR